MSSSHIVPLNTQVVREDNKKQFSIKKIKEVTTRRKNRNRKMEKQIEQKNPNDDEQSLIRTALLKFQQEELDDHDFQYFSNSKTISNTSFRTSFRNDILRFSGDDTLCTPTLLGVRMACETSELSDSSSEEEGTKILIQISSDSSSSSGSNNGSSSSEEEDEYKESDNEENENSGASTEETSGSSTSISSESSDYEPVAPRKKRVVQKNLIIDYPKYDRKSFKFSPIQSSSDILENSSELVLKDYQLEAINFLFKNYCEDRPCCLGHEMGLGKTIITLSTLDTLYKKLGVFGPFLITVPLTTLPNWEREASKWLPHFKIHTAWGTQVGDSKKQSLLSMATEYSKSLSTKSPLIVLTTYEFLKQHSIHSRRWACIAFDEAHKLKSKKTQWRVLAQKMKRDFLFLLTGTPMQNSPEELWSLLNLLDKEAFPNFEKFEKLYGELDSEAKIQDLKVALTPYLLRRTKTQVLKDKLPPKEEILVEVELTSIQKSVYRAIIERKIHFFRKQFSSKQDLSYIVNNLRYCCNHPCLISGMEEYLRDEEKKDEKSILIYSSSKMVVVHKLLKKIRDANEKVLIVSQFLDTLNVLEDYLHLENISYVRIDGSVDLMERQQNIDKFQTDPDCRVFLLSTKVGQGINLTAANHVIIYDSDYNPFNDSQAAARCHRIGQTNKVFVYRLITKDSYEKYIITRASKKLGREKLVLSDTKESDNDIAAEELERMIKYGVYSMFLNKENNDKKDNELINTDIDKILEESAKVQVQGEEDGPLVDTLNRLTGNEDSLKESSLENQPTDLIKSVYFVPVEEVTDVALDDPNFWDKTFPDYCDLYTLQSRLDDYKPFEAQEFESYFKKLEILVSDTINDKQQVSKETEKLSDVIEEDKKSVTSKHQLHSFLLNMQNPRYNHHNHCLREEHTGKINDWLDKLETKTLRNRKVWSGSAQIVKEQQQQQKYDTSSSSEKYDTSSSSEDDFEYDIEELTRETEQLTGKKANKKKPKSYSEGNQPKRRTRKGAIDLPHKEPHHNRSLKKELNITYNPPPPHPLPSNASLPLYGRFQIHKPHPKVKQTKNQQMVINNMANQPTLPTPPPLPNQHIIASTIEANQHLKPQDQAFPSLIDLTEKVRSIPPIQQPNNQPSPSTIPPLLVNPSPQPIATTTIQQPQHKNQTTTIQQPQSVSNSSTPSATTTLARLPQSQPVNPTPLQPIRSTNIHPTPHHTTQNMANYPNLFNPIPQFFTFHQQPHSVITQTHHITTTNQHRVYPNYPTAPQAQYQLQNQQVWTHHTNSLTPSQAQHMSTTQTQHISTTGGNQHQVIRHHQQQQFVTTTNNHPPTQHHSIRAPPPPTPVNTWNQVPSRFEQTLQQKTPAELISLRDQFTNTLSIINSQYNGHDKKRLLSKNQTIVQMIDRQIQKLQTPQQVNPSTAGPMTGSYFGLMNTYPTPVSTHTTSRRKSRTQSDGSRSAASSSTTIIQNNNSLIKQNSSHNNNQNMVVPAVPRPTTTTTATAQTTSRTNNGHPLATNPSTTTTSNQSVATTTNHNNASSSGTSSSSNDQAITELMPYLPYASGQ